MSDKILKIINHYGVRHQLKYFQSEVFELNEAIIEFENDEYTYYSEVEKSRKKTYSRRDCRCRSYATTI